MNIEVRVYDVDNEYDADHSLHLNADSAESRLSLTVIQGEHAATIVVDRDGAKKLRLALQRFERSR